MEIIRPGQVTNQTHLAQIRIESNPHHYRLVETAHAKVKPRKYVQTIENICLFTS